MDCDVGHGDSIRPKSSMDFDPLHQPQTQITFWEIQTFGANSKWFFSCGWVDWIVYHSKEITDFNKMIQIQTDHNPRIAGLETVTSWGYQAGKTEHDRHSLMSNLMTD